jgi:hypothetical protein
MLQVEVDETLIGGKVRNMHKARKLKVQKISQKSDKTIVLGILDCASGNKSKRVRATFISDRKKNTMLAEVGGVVEKGTKVSSDAFGEQWTAKCIPRWFRFLCRGDGDAERVRNRSLVEFQA